ncbi:UNVERIFIED_CONTAM: Receptor-type tyrosine-protein phosphatase eta [Trichonephila clavipes]
MSTTKEHFEALKRIDGMFAGVGRTGTFIAVDRIMQHVQQKEDVDIYGTVLDMRRYRPHIVHTADQYIFIYSCINQFILDKKEAQEDFYEIYHVIVVENKYILGTFPFR